MEFPHLPSSLPQQSSICSLFSCPPLCPVLSYSYTCPYPFPPHSCRLDKKPAAETKSLSTKRRSWRRPTAASLQSCIHMQGVSQGCLVASQEQDTSCAGASSRSSSKRVTKCRQCYLKGPHLRPDQCISHI